MKTVVLDRAHTHEGLLRKVDSELTLLAHDARWLVDRGIAHFLGGDRAVTPSNSSAGEDSPATGEPVADGLQPVDPSTESIAEPEAGDIA